MCCCKLIVKNVVYECRSRFASLGLDIFMIGFEIDEDALKIARDYSKKENLDIKWRNLAIENIEENFETILMNPPFGSQRPGADRSFLKKSLEIAVNIWTIHLAETRDFVEDFVKQNSGDIISAYEFDFKIKRSMDFHTKDIKKEKAILYHIASLR